MRLIRHETALLLAYGLLFAALLSPVLFAGYRFAQTDAQYQIYPLIVQMKQNLFSNGMFWNPQNFHGFPSLLIMGLVYEPLLSILLLLLPPLTAYHWTIWCYAVSGAWLVSLTCRCHGLSTPASCVVGFMFSLTLWSWIWFSSVAWFLPLFGALVFSLKMLGDRPVRLFSAVSVLTALAWLGLHFHYAVMFLIAGGLYLPLSTRCHRGRSCLLFLAATATGTFCGLLRTLPALAYGLLSSRTTSFNAELLRTAHLGLNDMVHTLFFPQLALPFFTEGAELLVYTGPLLAVIAGLGWFAANRRLRVYCETLFAVPVLLLLPLEPFHGLRMALYEHMSLLRYLGSPSRFLHLSALAVLPLIGIGIDALSQGESRYGRSLRHIGTGLLLLGAAGILASAVVSASAFVMPAVAAQLDHSLASHWAEFMQHLPENAQAALADQQPHIAGLLGALAIALGNTVRARYGLLEPHVLLPLLSVLLSGIVLRMAAKRFPPPSGTVVLTGAALLTVVAGWVPWMQAGYVSISPVPPPLIQYLQQQTGAVVFAFLTAGHYPELWTGNEEFLRLSEEYGQSIFMPNTNLQWSLMNADYYDVLGWTRMARLVGAIGGQVLRLPPEEMLSLSPQSGPEKMAVLRQRRDLLNLLNVTHVVSLLPLEEIGLKKEFTRRIPGMTEAGAIAVYRNDAAAPEVYFTGTAWFQNPDGDLAWQRMLDSSRPTRRLLVECEHCEGRREETYTATGRILVHGSEPTRLAVELQLAAPQRVVLSRNFLPGWRLRLDGRRYPTELAHSVFPTVRVPAGTHAVSFEFSYRALMEDSVQVILRRPLVYNQ